MFDFSKLLGAKRVVVSYLDTNVNADYVKAFREKYNLTQTALANIMNVSRKSIEKWERGTRKISGSSAVLLTLLNDNPELLSKVYSVKRIGEV